MFNKIIMRLESQGEVVTVSAYQTFLDLFLTLDCYGSHLIKQLWQSLESLFAFQECLPPGLPSVQELIVILFEKFARHDNSSVTKYCAKQFLKMRGITRLEEYASLLTSSLVDILNLPMFYQDVDFEKDAKMTLLVIDYYAFVFSHLDDETAVTYLGLFLDRVLEKSAFVHCIVTFLGVFFRVRALPVLDADRLERLLLFIGRHYAKHQFRKKIRLFNSLVALLTNFL